MKYPRYVIESIEIVTEFDDEDAFTDKIRIWSRPGCCSQIGCIGNSMHICKSSKE